MAVTDAQQRRADRMAGEQDRLVAAGIASSRSIIAKARGAIIREWRNGGDLTAPLAALRPKLAAVVNTGMVASHLQGTLRAAIAVKRVRGVALASAVDDFAAKLAGQLDWSGSGLDSLSSRYSDAARQAADEAVDAAIRLITKQARVLAVQGVSTSSGVAELRAALDSAGLSLDRPALVETVYRTEFQSTYQAARWQANEAPEIQSILWGYEYVTVGDDRVRPSHAALEGMRLEKNDPRWERLWPPNGFNCFLPGTVVAGEFVVGVVANYRGVAVDIETSDGKIVSVTEKHPILVSGAWTSAGDVAPNDRVLANNGSAIGMKIERVVEHARQMSKRKTLSAIGSGNFYGDGVRMHGEAEIIGLDGIMDIAGMGFIKTCANDLAKWNKDTYDQMWHELPTESGHRIEPVTVKSVRKYLYNGPVYDLQSTTGWLLSNGIVTSNCRCQTIEIFRDERIARVIEPPEPEEVDGVMVIPGPDEGFDVNVGILRR